MSDVGLTVPPSHTNNKQHANLIKPCAINLVSLGKPTVYSILSYMNLWSVKQPTPSKVRNQKKKSVKLPRRKNTKSTSVLRVGGAFRCLLCAEVKTFTRVMNLSQHIQQSHKTVVNVKYGMYKRFV